MTEAQLLFSPRLAALQHTLTSGNEAALDLFWQEIEAVGTPLIESTTRDDSQVLVTFLYRAPLAVRSVEVVCPLAGRGQINEPMTRLLVTSLWYKTYRVRPGLRTEYRFSVDGVAHPDRLNSRTLIFPPDEDAFHDKAVPRSWFEIPPAEAESWMESRPSFPSGQVERVRLRSLVLGNERPLSIYTPAGSDAASQPQHLLLLFDRWAYAHVLPTAPMLDQLIAERSIPPLLVVMVGHPDDTARSTELACHAPFADFLVQELLPWIRHHYQVSPHPDQMVVGGMSYGGLAAAYAGLRYPEVFGNVLSQSGSFYWKPDSEVEYEWLPRKYVASPRLPLHWYLSAGLLETHCWEGARPNLLLANRHLRDILQAKGYCLHYTEFNGGHDYVWQLTSLAEGLRVLLGTAARKG
jgi:enterochelin esterase-like enzyme